MRVNVHCFNAPDSHSNSRLINQVICDTFDVPRRAEIRELLTIRGVLSSSGVLGGRGDDRAEGGESERGRERRQ